VRSPGKHLFAAIAALIALAVVAPACSAVDPSALTVESWSMSDSTFQSQLSAFAKVYDASGGTASLRSPDGKSWTTSFTAAFLNDQLSLQAAKVGVRQRGLTVTDDDLVAAKTTLEQNFTAGSRSVFADLPASYQMSLVEGVAAQEVLARAVIAEARSDAALRSLYEATKDQYAGDLVCASHILVLAGSGSANAKPTDAQYATALSSIQAIRGQLTGTSNFASVAEARSQDTGSAANGGALGCAARGSYVTAFDDAAWTQPIGVVGEPVKTEFGYHLILVTARGKLGFDDLRTTLEQNVLQSAQQLVDVELARLARDLSVSVDPRYGRFDAATGRIQPPAGASEPMNIDSGALPAGG
jgi:parvulin-like peptidyl-prolyl isomerase